MESSTPLLPNPIHQFLQTPFLSHPPQAQCQLCCKHLEHNSVVYDCHLTETHHITNITVRHNILMSWPLQPPNTVKPGFSCEYLPPSYIHGDSGGQSLTKKMTVQLGRISPALWNQLQLNGNANYGENDSEGNLPCSHCHLVFPNAASRSAHLRWVERLPQTEKKNPEQQRSRPRATSLDSVSRVPHLTSVERGSGQEPGANCITCFHCPRTFASRAAYNRHLFCLRRSEIITEKIYRRERAAAAVICPTTTHQDDEESTEVDCCVCHSSWASFRECVEHAQSAHSRPEDNLLPCPHCKEAFKNYRLLRRHMKQMHKKKKRNSTASGVNGRRRVPKEESVEVNEHEPEETAVDLDNGQQQDDTEQKVESVRPSVSRARGEEENTSDGTFREKCVKMFATMDSSSWTEKEKKYYLRGNLFCFCPYCPARWPSTRLSLEHIMAEHAIEVPHATTGGGGVKKVFPCTHCDMHFDVYLKLHAHRTHVHRIPGRRTLVRMTRENPTSVAVAVATAKMERAAVGPVKGGCTKKEQLYIRHGVLMIGCYYCSKKFASKRLRNMHADRYHRIPLVNATEGEQTDAEMCYPCPRDECSEQMQSYVDVARHMMSKHRKRKVAPSESNGENVDEEQTKAKMARDESHESKEENFLEEVAQPNQLPQVSTSENKVFVTRHSSATTTRLQKSASKPLYPCRHCRVPFRTVEETSEHQANCLLLPRDCQSCGAEFHSHYALQMHQKYCAARDHLQASGEDAVNEVYPQECTQCGEKLSSQLAQVHHSTFVCTQPPTLSTCGSVPRLGCPVCGLTFATEKRLTSHQRCCHAQFKVAQKRARVDWPRLQAVQYKKVEMDTL